MLIDKNSNLSEVLSTVFDELRQAVKEPNHPFRFMSLATVKQDKPEIRYVVLRAMDNQNHLFFFTDYRSAKIDQIQLNSEVAMHFYDPEARVQVRMTGTAHIHKDGELANKYWKMVEGDARKAYTSIEKPGTPVTKPTDAHQWSIEKESNYFAVIEIVPTKIDVVQLDGLHHIRANFLRNEGRWTMNWVAP